MRAYANLANEMNEAGYSDAEAQEIKEEVRHYQNVSQEIKLASGDYVDLKAYEPDMRHLIDTYIGAEESETLSTLGDTPLFQLIVENGPGAMDLLPGGVRNSEAAAAATIENNIRRLIVDRSEVNPRYYEHISRLLNDIIRRRRDDRHWIIAHTSPKSKDSVGSSPSQKTRTGTLPISTQTHYAHSLTT